MRFATYFEHEDGDIVIWGCGDSEEESKKAAEECLAAYGEPDSPIEEKKTVQISAVAEEIVDGGWNIIYEIVGEDSAVGARDLTFDPNGNIVAGDEL